MRFYMICSFWWRSLFIYLCACFVCNAFAKSHVQHDDVAVRKALQMIELRLNKLPPTVSDPLAKALKPYRIGMYDSAKFSLKMLHGQPVSAHVTEFSVVYDESQKMLMPKRPKDVSKDEWRAIVTFLKSFDHNALTSENQHYQFMLIDLDDDGLRDLVMSYYAGGTGLFTQFIVYKREGSSSYPGAFMSHEALDQEEFPTAAWQGISGRPVYQNFFFVKLYGKTYVAYIEHDYATEVLTLYRAFSSKSPKQQLLLKYVHEYELFPKFGFETTGAVDQYQEITAKSFNAWVTQNQVLVDEIHQRLSALVRDVMVSKKTNEVACPYAPKKDEESSHAVADEQMQDWGYPLHYTMLKGDSFWLRTKAQCLYAEIVCVGGANFCELNLYQQPGELYQSLSLKHKRAYRVGQKLIDFSVRLTP